MSSALVRQALALVDQEEDSSDKSNKRKSGAPRRRAGQDPSHPYRRHKKPVSKETKSKEQIAEENVKKLLVLTSPAADSNISHKIVERAIKGRPLADKIEVSKEEEKSILFPDEPFEQFEQELFCSRV